MRAMVSGVAGFSARFELFIVRVFSLVRWRRRPISRKVNVAGYRDCCNCNSNANFAPGWFTCFATPGCGCGGRHRTCSCTRRSRREMPRNHIPCSCYRVSGYRRRARHRALYCAAEIVQARCCPSCEWWKLPGRWRFCSAQKLPYLQQFALQRVYPSFQVVDS